MTALALALNQAGYVAPAERLKAVLLEVARQSPEQWALAEGSEIDPEADRQHRRLKHLATEALNANPRNWDGAKDAFYKAVKNDAGLLWELFAPYRQQATQLLMAKAAEELRELERRRKLSVSSAGGHVAVENHRSCAPRANSRSAMSAVSNVARLSLLDTFKVNGQPIGDLTPGEARRWAVSQRRNARFVELLTANLPDGQPIRKHRTSDDTQALYEQASQEASDAQ